MRLGIPAWVGSKCQLSSLTSSAPFPVTLRGKTTLTTGQRPVRYRFLASALARFVRVRVQTPKPGCSFTYQPTEYLRAVVPWGVAQSDRSRGE